MKSEPEQSLKEIPK